MRINIKQQTNKDLAGSLIVYSPSGEPYAIAPGIAGQFLQVNSNSNGVQWSNPSAFASNFILSDNTNQQLVNSSDTLTFNKNNGLRVTVSANRNIMFDIDPIGNLQGLIGGLIGDILYHDGISFKKLAIGSSGRILTSNGSTPQWVTPTTGGGGGTNTLLTVNSSSSISLTANGIDSHTLTAVVKTSPQTGNQLQSLPDGLNVNNYNYFNIYLSKGTATSNAIYPDFDDLSLSNTERYVTLYTSKTNLYLKEAMLRLKNTATGVTSFVLRNLVTNNILATFAVNAGSSSPIIVSLGVGLTNLNINSFPKLQFEVVQGDVNIGVEMVLSYLEY